MLHYSNVSAEVLFAIHYLGVAFVMHCRGCGLKYKLR